jgi:amino acid transporter
MAAFNLRRFLIGRPLRSEHAVHERLPIVLALPIFASDALSSVAYATEAILRQYQNLQVRQDQWPVVVWISVGIIALILMVVASYREVIFAYPRGGGSYVVARENLGLLTGLIAASALLVDYVLTVAVSIADCVAQSDSALSQLGGVWAQLFDYKVPAALLLVAVITLANLRGVRESGALFAGPSYGFIAVILTMVGCGVFRVLMGYGPVESVKMEIDPKAVVEVNWLILLRGFASGCAALTGIEAVSNGVQAFREPSDRNAVTTLRILGGILATMFIGLTFLAVRLQIAPNEKETVVSQIARATFGTSLPGGILYYGVQIFTALILFLAANTAFAGFPRLASILAEDGFLPRQLANVGERLAYNNGIIMLGLLACGFLVMFQGEAHALLPLYTIGVFIAFTTAQAGMVRKSLRVQPRPWAGLTINAVGATITGLVLMVVTYTKFIAWDQHPLFGTTWLYEGAWMAILLMGLIVGMFYGIHEHYRKHDAQLAVIPENWDQSFKHTVIVLVPSRIHRGVVQALNYARSISPDALALHISFDPVKKERLHQQWGQYGGDMPLLILDSPFRTLIDPLMNYLDAADKVRSDDVITVILPEYVPAKWWHNILHNASGWLIRLRLYNRRDIVLVSVRYYLDE